jgi:hypothetical protein
MYMEDTNKWLINLDRTWVTKAGSTKKSGPVVALSRTMPPFPITNLSHLPLNPATAGNLFK